MINDALRQIFLLRAKWKNFEHPAYPKSPEQRFIDLKTEFFLVSHAYGHRGAALSRSMNGCLDKIAHGSGVLRACQFGVKQIKEIRALTSAAYQEEDNLYALESSIWGFITSRSRYMSEPSDDKAFCSPIVNRIYKHVKDGEKEIADQEQEKSPFKVRIDNERIEYFKNVKAFLEEALELVSEFDFSRTDSFVADMNPLYRLGDVLNNVEAELEYLSNAEVVDLLPKTEQPQGPPR